MDSCRVTFTAPNGQKIILTFTYDKQTDNLDFTPKFEPPVDPKTDLGLAGQLCEMFIKNLYKTDEKSEN